MKAEQYEPYASSYLPLSSKQIEMMLAMKIIIVGSSKDAVNRLAALEFCLPIVKEREHQAKNKWRAKKLLREARQLGE